VILKPQSGLKHPGGSERQVHRLARGQRAGPGSGRRGTACPCRGRAGRRRRRLGVHPLRAHSAEHPYTTSTGQGQHIGHDQAVGRAPGLAGVGGGLLGPPSGPVIELPIQLQRGPDVDRCRVDGGRATSSKGRPASQITITSRGTGPRRSMASRYGQAGWYRRWGGDVPEADLSVGGGGGQQLVPRVDRHRAKDEGMRQPSHQRAAGGIPHGGGPAAGGEQGAVGGERQAPDPAAVCR
jgi:hypothetical protein